MTPRHWPATTATSAGLLLLVALGAMAGDEDISPNAYQEFDPVTGYMITVDPDSENGQGHASGDAQRTDAGAHSGNVDLQEQGLNGTWLYLAIVAVALFVIWIRGKTRRNSTL